jgi:hypothetical protein
MTILRIPLPKGVPSFSQRVMLEQLEYIFDLHWNQRAERWYLQLYDSTGELITARKVIANWPLLLGVVHESRPPGELVATDTQQLTTPIGLYDLGDRILLSYLEAADLAELVGS